MKKLSFLLTAIIFFLLFACHNDKQTSHSLIGRWEMIGDNVNEKVLSLCMYEDSTFTMSTSLGAVPQSGEWRICDDTLKCYGNRNDFTGRTMDYYEFVFKIVRHDEKYLFLGDFDTKQVMELERVHE